MLRYLRITLFFVIFFVFACYATGVYSTETKEKISLSFSGNFIDSILLNNKIFIAHEIKDIIYINNKSYPELKSNKIQFVKDAVRNDLYLKNNNRVYLFDIKNLKLKLIFNIDGAKDVLVDNRVLIYSKFQKSVNEDGSQLYDLYIKDKTNKKLYSYLISKVLEVHGKIFIFGGPENNIEIIKIIDRSGKDIITIDWLAQLKNFPFVEDVLVSKGRDGYLLYSLESEPGAFSLKKYSLDKNFKKLKEIDAVQLEEKINFLKFEQVNNEVYLCGVNKKTDGIINYVKASALLKK